MGAPTPEAVRWAARPRWASAVRLAVFLGPVLASFAAAWGVTRVLPASSGRAEQALHLAELVVFSTAVLVVLDRSARRLLPLVTLLNLSLLFPRAAPSRLKVAREAIRRRPIEEQLARVRKAGADPSAVATEILSLVAALSSHDRPTRGHAERVRMFTDLIAEQMRLPERDRDLLRWAAILHDIGKLRVPASLLNKSGKPNEKEWAVLQGHPVHGVEIAGALLPWLGEWGQVIVEHHERWDGTGYPHGLAGRGIHLGSRIVSVADAFDVMTSARAYKRPVSRAAAYRELIRFSGTQFDPVAVRAMVSVSAPQLRRAQGVLAWLADLPLVATHVVPAATLARVVGAGAVATGVVAGGGVLATGPAPAATLASPQVSHSTRATSTHDPAQLKTSGPTGGADPTGSAPRARATATAKPSSGPAPGDGSGGGPTPSSTPGPTGPTSSSRPSTNVGATVAGVVGGVTGTVDGLTGPVLKPVTTPVATAVTGLTGVVDEAAGGLVGGLLGP
ncbi:MAG: HD-GYP domain-containing protein [Sporichthyaceae bacterium]